MSIYFSPRPVEYFAQLVAGRVTQKIERDRPGQVFYGGTHWRARLAGWELDIALGVGERVAIVGRQGTTLLVSSDWIGGG